MMVADASPGVLRSVAIIQARMLSSRLPGKVLLPIGDQPMLAHVVARTRRAEQVAEVVVATTVDPSDDPVAVFCEAAGIACVRGSRHDVLDRYYQAVQLYQAGVVVRITADCPLIDPTVIDRTVRAFLGLEQDQVRVLEGSPGRPRITPQFAGDFAANRLPPPWGRTYPIGLDTEVCAFGALQQAWERADQAYQREHVMPYFYDTPGRFRVLLVDHTEDLGALRLTVDTPEDLEFMRRVFARLSGRPEFSWLDAVALVRAEPDLLQINAGVRHKLMREVDARLEAERLMQDSEGGE